MGPTLIWVVVVVVAVVAYLVGCGRPKASAPLKAFGLEAYEAQGLSKASDDVLKAVVATISFLGHPFTVVAEANEARADSVGNSARALAKVQDNLEAIKDLEADNVELRGLAKAADARANALNALVAQVSSVVGGK